MSRLPTITIPPRHPLDSVLLLRSTLPGNYHRELTCRLVEPAGLKPPLIKHPTGATPTAMDLVGSNP